VECRSDHGLRQAPDLALPLGAPSHRIAEFAAAREALGELGQCACTQLDVPTVPCALGATPGPAVLSGTRPRRRVQGVAVLGRKVLKIRHLRTETLQPSIVGVGASRVAMPRADPRGQI
jgi:hypothetical protein